MKRIYNSKSYKYIFDTNTGFFARWGETAEDDPIYSPIGPEILDLEISDLCHGGCNFCYKNNNPVGSHMSLETFKTIIDKMPTLTQVAFGIGDLDYSFQNGLIEMFQYLRERNIVPNITINGKDFTIQQAKILAQYCGAVSISYYNLTDVRVAVEYLAHCGLKQINIHAMISEETYENVLELLANFYKYPELDNSWTKKVNAIVFLSLKTKGRGTGFTQLSMDKFTRLVEIVTDNKIPYGADSCTAHKLMMVIKDKELITYIEPCESGLFSAYVNKDGMYYPCSFAEGLLTIEGQSVLECNNFLEDIWNSNFTVSWREKLLQCNRNCPLYKI